MGSHLNTLLAVVAVIGFVRNMVVVNETDLSAALTVRVCSGELAPDTWAEVEFTTSDMPSADTSAAVCKYVNVHTFHSGTVEPLIKDN